MRLIATRSLGRFIAVGVVVLSGLYAFGPVAILGAVLGLGSVERAARTDWYFFDWYTDVLYLSGVGGVIGLIALLVCWLAILWPRFVDRSPRLLIFGLMVGIVSAIINLALVARHFSFNDTVGAIYLAVLCLYVVLALRFVSETIQRIREANGYATLRSI